MNLSLSPILSFYFFRVFLMWFAILFFIFAGLAVLIESAELLRRCSSKADVSLEIVLKMAFLKVPLLLQKLLTLFVLFGAFFGFRRLQRNSEVIVARASGFSLIQLLFPLAFCLLILGLLEVMLISPWVSFSQEKFEKMENKYIRHVDSQFMVSDTGLWLKQPEANGYTIVHVQKTHLAQRTFEGVSLYFFQDEASYLSRLDASSAVVKNGFWELEDPSYFSHQERPLASGLKFRTLFTPEKIEEFFVPAATLSFWQIPFYIKMIEKAGFTAISYRVQWHRLLALPLALMGMFLIGAALSLHNPRQSKGMWNMGICFFVGFLSYILQDITQVFALSFRIPVEAGLWGPPVVFGFLSLLYVIYLEH